VLVHGASGGVGLAAVQLARRRRLTVFAGDGGTDEGRQLVAVQGAHHVSITRGTAISKSRPR
jgi:NADPH2:quinone reductase